MPCWDVQATNQKILLQDRRKSSSREIFWTTSRSSAVRTGFPWKIMQSAAGKGQLLAHHEGPRQVSRFPHALEGRGL